MRRQDIAVSTCLIIYIEIIKPDDDDDDDDDDNDDDDDADDDDDTITIG